MNLSESVFIREHSGLNTPSPLFIDKGMSPWNWVGVEECGAHSVPTAGFQGVEGVSVTGKEKDCVVCVPHCPLMTGRSPSCPTH